MSVYTPSRSPAIEYPDRDGQPMADSTVQFRKIVTIKEGFENLYRNRDDVFIAGDLFCFPVMGQTGIRAAPDTMVVFGRPRGDRTSYKQWEEDDIAPQVAPRSRDQRGPIHRFRRFEGLRPGPGRRRCHSR